MKYIQVGSPLNRNVPRLSLYYLQRLMTKPALRVMTISLLRSWVALRTRRYLRRQGDQGEVLATLRADGIAPLGQVLSEEQCGDILRHLSKKHLSHREGAGFTIDAKPRDIAFANYALADLVSCPHILALANSPVILDLARHYLGCTPTISGLSARWSFPGKASGEVVQKFHRDSEDWLAFRIMVYLTEVDEAAGPHVYVKGTHLDRRTRRLPVLEDDAVRQRFGAHIQRQTGARGFGFAVDTAGLHKGEVPAGDARLLLSFQYSILPCFLYRYTPEWVATLAHDPYINRLIVRHRREGSALPIPDEEAEDQMCGESN